MQLIRRSAFRAINSSIATPRTLSTRTPFTIRPKSQSLSSTLFRRFASNDVSSETQEPPADTSARRTSESSSSPSSADQDDSSSIKSAIDSATESASTYASDAAESVSESYNSVKESVTDYAQAAGAAAGFSAPRSDRGQGEFQERRPYDRRDGDRARPAPVPTNSIYIGNLLFDATEADLRTLFTPYGEISKVTLATDLRGLSKGFAYVEFASTEEATAAIEGQHQQEFEGRRLIVNYQNKTKREIQKNDPSKTLFIGNLAFEMSDADLTKLFKDVRNVVDVRVAVDRRTGQPRGFAHAEFTDVDSATKGIDLLQGKEVYGRPIRCDFSGGGLRRDNQDGAEGRPERRGGYGGDRRGGGGGRGGYGGDRGGDRRSSGGYGGDRGNDRGGRGGYGGGERRGGGRGGGGYGGDQEGSSGRY